MQGNNGKVLLVLVKWEEKIILHSLCGLTIKFCLFKTILSMKQFSQNTMLALILLMYLYNYVTICTFISCLLHVLPL